MTIITKKFKITKKNALLGAFFVLSLLLYSDDKILAKSDDITADGVVRLVNDSRKESGLAPLKVNGQLEAAAKQKAKDMLEKDYFAHFSPSGVSPWDLIVQQGYDYKFAGENLAIDYASLSQQHQAWMESLLHRKNILNPEYTEIGVSVQEGEFNGRKTIISVQEFGTPVATIITNSKLKTSAYGSAVAGIAEEKAPALSSKVDQTQKPAINLQQKRILPTANFDQKLTVNDMILNDRLTLEGWLAMLIVAIFVSTLDLLFLLYKKHKQNVFYLK